MSSVVKTEPSRESIDSSQGLVLLEFGTEWCGHCQAALPFISEALSEFLNIQHFKIEDGQGRKLGRSFGVKLWPTLILIKDGLEVARVVRPTSKIEIEKLLLQS